MDEKYGSEVRARRRALNLTQMQLARATRGGATSGALIRPWSIANRFFHPCPKTTIAS